jgi:hypothetical protein
LQVFFWGESHTVCMTELRVPVLSFPDFTDISNVLALIPFASSPKNFFSKHCNLKKKRLVASLLQSRCLLARNLLDIFCTCDTWQNSARRGRCETIWHCTNEFRFHKISCQFFTFVCASKKMMWNVTLVKSVFRYKMDF